MVLAVALAFLFLALLLLAATRPGLTRRRRQAWVLVFGGGVVLEAMALGTPCVSTAVTGIPELVRDGQTGFCVPEGDPEALATALVRMLAVADLRQRFSTAGRALIAQEFDQHVNAARLRAIWHDAIAGTDLPQQRSA